MGRKNIISLKQKSEQKWLIQQLLYLFKHTVTEWPYLTIFSENIRYIQSCENGFIRSFTRHSSNQKNQIKVKVEKVQQIDTKNSSISLADFMLISFLLKSHFTITTYNWYFTLYCTAFEAVDRKPRICSPCDSFFRLGKY